jgi:hypothetical protein
MTERKWKFVGRNWLCAVDYEGKIRYLNLQWVTQVTWWKDDNEREWVFVKLVGDEYAIGFRAENFPRQKEWEKLLAQQGGEL